MTSQNYPSSRWLGPSEIDFNNSLPNFGIATITCFHTSHGDTGHRTFLLIPRSRQLKDSSLDYHETARGITAAQVSCTGGCGTAWWIPNPIFREENSTMPVLQQDRQDLNRGAREWSPAQVQADVPAELSEALTSESQMDLVVWAMEPSSGVQEYPSENNMMFVSDTAPTDTSLPLAVPLDFYVGSLTGTRSLDRSIDAKRQEARTSYLRQHPVPIPENTIITEEPNSQTTEKSEGRWLRHARRLSDDIMNKIRVRRPSSTLPFALDTIDDINANALSLPDPLGAQLSPSEMLAVPPTDRSGVPVRLSFEEGPSMEFHVGSRDDEGAVE